mmetsp:Transcript_2695/g.6990  ORF Transcript_2695/g.6990 Transcript_2695/m.6990 type:complete len:200 (-) Transcript_2695:726-1325(-)
MRRSWCEGRGRQRKPVQRRTECGGTVDWPAARRAPRLVHAGLRHAVAGLGHRRHDALRGHPRGHARRHARRHATGWHASHVLLLLVIGHHPRAGRKQRGAAGDGHGRITVHHTDRGGRRRILLGLLSFLGRRALVNFLDFVVEMAGVLDDIGHDEVDVTVAPGEFDGDVGLDMLVAGKQGRAETLAVATFTKEAKNLLG